MVTGGAGYIGAHVVQALQANGNDVVVVDDLSTGIRARVPQDVPLERLNVCDLTAVGDAVARHRPDGVIHLAGRKDVAESTSEPLRYYQENLDGLRCVLHAVASQRVKHVLFSSSAAVYGNPVRPGPVPESAFTKPENPYGRTKLIGEWLLRDAAASAGFGWAALRYFNVAGAGCAELADRGLTNLVPRLLKAAHENTSATVYGGDYPTRDGSAIRDYVHVCDVAEAHVQTALALAGGILRADVLNVGRGAGASVLEMIDAVGRACGSPLSYVVGQRRAGDPAEVVASVDLIAQRVGWTARFELDDIVASAAGKFALASTVSN
jgi:UDP-glucose 4-epimerase